MAELTKSYPVFDCDAHVFESLSIWQDYLSDEDKVLVRDQGYWADPDYAGLGLLNGWRFAGGVTGLSSWGGAPGMTPEISRRLNQMELTPEQHEYLSVGGSYEPDHRIREMDLTGIDQVLVIPTSFNGHFPFILNPYAARALAAAYNDWAHDYCSYHPERLFAAALLPIQEGAFAADEIYQRAKQGWHVGLVRPLDANDRYPNDPSLEPMWRAFEETGMVVGMHAFAGGSIRYPSYWPINQFVNVFAKTQSSPSELIWEALETTELVQGMRAQDLSFIWESMTWLSGVLLSGFLDRHPRMRMAIYESNASWLPTLLEECDRAFKLFGRERRADAKRLPSEAFFEQCIISFESDEMPVYRLWKYFEPIGIWASDQYHPDAEDAWEAVEKMERGGVPEAVQAKLLGTNAARAYGIEPKLFVTTSRYDEIQRSLPPWLPTPEEVEIGMSPEAAVEASRKLGSSPRHSDRPRGASFPTGQRTPLAKRPNQIPEHARRRPAAPAPTGNGRRNRQ